MFIALIRLTYGFGKTSDRIASSQIESLTGIECRNVRRILVELEALGMVERGAVEQGRSRRIGIVIDFDRWDEKTTTRVTHAPPVVIAPRVARDPGVGSHVTPQPGSPTPPTKEKERFTRESPGAVAPAHPRGLSGQKVKVQTSCPRTLTPDQRAEVRAWRDLDFPNDFDDAELLAQWKRFYRWNRGRRCRSADWPSTFCNWLTNPNYKPAKKPSAAARTVEAWKPSGPPPAMTAAEAAALALECREIRAAAAKGRKKSNGAHSAIDVTAVE